MSSRTLRQLADDLSRMSVELPRQVASENDVKAAVFILGELLLNTPIDSSTAVSNWQVSLNLPVSKTLPAYFKGVHGTTGVLSRDAAMRVAREVLAVKKPGDRVYIGNALPYIRRLNDGHSKQAPAGWIERATLLGRLFSERH